MSLDNSFLINQLKQRSQAGSLRRLSLTEFPIDFCSNDYLGFCRSGELQAAIAESTVGLANGAGAARLLGGGGANYLEIEKELAGFYKTEAALSFSSGYQANLALFSTLPQRGDLIIYDQLIHASMRDGIRLGLARSRSFKHNDLVDLEGCLMSHSCRKFVAIEALYSMDGDQAPLLEIAALCERYGAYLLVDEAHSTGVFGDQGAGLCQALGVEQQVFARVHTFGKALGVHGACIAASQVVIDFLVNFSRPFIYTTAQAPHQMLALYQAHVYCRAAKAARETLAEVSAYFNQVFSAADLNFLGRESQIKAVLVSGNAAARALAGRLQKAGVGVYPILSPTVPKGQERLRICLHSFNSRSEIDLLAKLIREAYDE